MASLAAFVRIALHTPTTRMDVAVPAEVPLVTFLPALLTRAGLDTDATRPGATGWAVRRIDGSLLDLSAGLAANGVVDGDVLIVDAAASTVHGPLFDDVVDAIHSTAGDRWTAQDRRRAAALTAGSAAVALAAGLVRLAPGLPLGLVAAALLLVGGYVVAGVDVALGRCTAGFAAPFAVGGGVSLSGGGAGSVAACAGLACVGAVLAVLGDVAGAGACGVLSAAGAAGVAIADRCGVVHAIATVGCLALAATTAFPALALRLTRVPVPDLGGDDGHEQGHAWLVRRVDRARRLLWGMTGGALATVVVAVIVLSAQPGRWNEVLGGLLLVLVVLRVRRHAERIAVLLAAAAGWAGLVGALVVVALRGDVHLVTAASGGALVAAVVVGARSGRRPGSPRVRWALDVLEALGLAAVAPLLIAVWDVYRRVGG